MDIPPPPPSRPFPQWIRWVLIGISALGTISCIAFQVMIWAEVQLATGSAFHTVLVLGALVAFLGAVIFLQQKIRNREGESITDRRSNILASVKKVPVWRVILFFLIMGYVGWTFIDPELSRQRELSPFLFNYGAALLMLLPIRTKKSAI